MNEDIKITIVKGKVSLYINGFEIQKVRSLSFEATVGEVPNLNIDLIPYGEIIKEEKE